jgi:hypothetical protein
MEEYLESYSLGHRRGPGAEELILESNQNLIWCWKADFISKRFIFIP